MISHYLLIGQAEDYHFLVMACDGIFDVYGDQELVEAIEREIKKVGKIDPQNLVRTMVRKSIERGSEDNITMMLIPLALHRIPVSEKILKKRVKVIFVS